MYQVLTLFCGRSSLRIPNRSIFKAVYNATLIHDEDLVAPCLSEMGAVRCEKNGFPFPEKFIQNAFDPSEHNRIKILERFVQNEKIGTMYEGTHQGDTFFHAGGKLLNACVLPVGHGEPVQQCLDPVPTLSDMNSKKGTHEVQVFSNSQFLDEDRVIEYKSDTMQYFLWLVIGWILEQSKGASVGMDQAGQVANDSRFSCPVGAQ